MSTCISQPPAIMTAFNPIIFKFQTSTSETEKQLIIYDSLTDEAIATLTAEYFNDVATFNISELIKRKFSETSSGTTIINNKLLYYRFYVSEDDIDASFIAINAVSQFGHSQNLNNYLSKFLTQFDRIIRYSGYEYQLYFLRDGSIQFKIKEDDVQKYENTEIELDTVYGWEIQSAQSEIELDTKSATEYLMNNLNEIITDVNGEAIVLSENASEFQTSDSRTIELRSVPTHPFYVRWVNRQGGYDYWMFDCRQFLTNKLSSVQTYSTYTEDVQTASGNKFPYASTAERTATVAASMLTRNQYQVISRLLFSPTIEWYCEETASWLRIIPADGETELATYDARTDIVFTFKLPTPQLQY